MDELDTQGRREHQWWLLAGVLFIGAVVSVTAASVRRLERIAWTQGAVAGHRAGEIRERVLKEEPHD
jgi:hypothetical protein